MVTPSCCFNNTRARASLSKPTNVVCMYVCTHACRRSTGCLELLEGVQPRWKAATARQTGELDLGFYVLQLVALRPFVRKLRVFFWCCSFSIRRSPIPGKVEISPMKFLMYSLCESEVSCRGMGLPPQLSSLIQDGAVTARPNPMD